MARPRERLIEVLTELEKVLSSDGEQHWLRWMSGAKAKIEQGDFTGIDEVLEAYGGMSSFNDLVLGQDMSGGQFRWKPGATKLNQRLERLREDAHELAVDARRLSL